MSSSSNAHVIKTVLPTPPPSVDVLLRQVRAAIEDLKAKDIVEIDVRGKTSVCDFLLIASGTSRALPWPKPTRPLPSPTTTSAAKPKRLPPFTVFDTRLM